MLNADDTCLLFTDMTRQNVYIKATKGFNLIYKCLNEICLTMNYDKTMYIKFSINKCNNYESPLLINNCNNYMKCNVKMKTNKRNI